MGLARVVLRGRYAGLTLPNRRKLLRIKYYLDRDSGFKIQDSRFKIQKEKYENLFQAKK